MIIKEVKLEQRLFFSDKVVVLTDRGKIFFPAEGWEEKEIKNLNSLLNDFRIENVDDLAAMRRKLKSLSNEKYLIIEGALLNQFESVWKFINQSAVQVPRPMSIVFSNSAMEFVVLSLNAKNFSVALNSNRHIIDKVSKRTEKLSNVVEKDILIAIKEAVDEEHALVDFEIRLGVVFNNCKNNKYIYGDRALNKEEQFDFVSKLISKYDLVYVENPFSEEDFEMYKKLADKFRKKSLICINSSDETYSRSAEKKAFNCAVARFSSVAGLSSNVNFFREKKLNIVAEGREDAVEAAVGLGIPIVKLTDDKTGNSAANKLNRISEQILASRLKAKIADIK